MKILAYLGYLDINVYSSSSPGLSGAISPFANTSGLYFDDKPEPQNQEFEIMQELNRQSEKEGKLVVYIGGNDAMKYYEAKYKLMEECENFDVHKNHNDNKLHLHINRDTFSMFI